MKKQHLFITLIALGVLGRWILIPSIKRLKAESLRSEQAQSRRQVKSCLEQESCSIYELSSDKVSSGETRLKAREFLLKNWEVFLKENEYLSWKLRGKLISNLDNLSILDQNKKHINAFLEGLYLCHERDCLEFFLKNKEAFFSLSYEHSAKLSLKQEGSWSNKNKELKKLLKFYSKNSLHFKVVELIDFIPNHPQVKRFIEYHYLKVNKLSHIEDASIHLARYSRGWHDRAYKKVLGSNSKAHIQNFLKVMRVGCPSRLSKIYDYWDKWDKHTRSIAKEQGRYLLKDEAALLKKVSITKSELILGAKCISSPSQI